MIHQGVYTDLSSEDYHADKHSISRSALMDFAVTPHNYWAKHLNPDRPKKDATPAMLFGTAFHTLILEPKVFDAEYIMLPEAVKLKDVGRKDYDAYKNIVEYIEKGNKKVLTAIEWNNLMAMKARLESNEQAMNLIRDSRIENSFFWKDEDSGLMVKARPDILHPNMIVDLKTCADASPRACQRAMIEGGYHLQGAMIREAVSVLEANRIDVLINICIETKYPYNMSINIIEKEAIDAGHDKFKRLLVELRHCLDNSEFPDYGVNTISLPGWAI